MTRASVAESIPREPPSPTGSAEEPGCGGNEQKRLEDDPRWQVALRIVASRHFIRSALLSRFLLFIVREAILERTESITEHEIGVRVFDRPASYRTVEDNIVRNYARQLRRRIGDYFSGEGCAEPLSIDIPLGAYVPVFVELSAKRSSPFPLNGDAIPFRVVPQAPASPAPAMPQGIRRRRLPRGLLIGALLAVYSLALMGSSWLLAAHLHGFHPVAEDRSPSALLWSTLFRNDMNTWIVPSDAGLNILEDLSHRPVSLADYMNGGALHLALPAIDSHSEEDLRGQRFTSFVDLEIISALSRLPQFNPERDVLRFPRDFRLDDIRNANAVVLGSVSSNPWAVMADANSNFRVIVGTDMQGAVIMNAHPEPGESKIYASHWNEPDHDTYALISCTPNLSGNGRLLVLEGLDVAGTQAAAEAVLHPTAIAPILKRATNADGTLRSFEVLLRTTSIQSTSTRTTVVASRID
jgi:hypothetical protein